MAFPLLLAFGVGQAIFEAVNTMVAANATAKAQALQDRQNTVNLKAQKYALEDQLRATGLQSDEIKSSLSSYEAFLEYFRESSMGADLSAELAVKDAVRDPALVSDEAWARYQDTRGGIDPDSQIYKDRARAAFEQVWNNYGVNDVVAGATGRTGGSQTSMGQAAASALASLRGEVSLASEQASLLGQSLLNLTASGLSLESTLAEVSSILGEDSSSSSSSSGSSADSADRADPVGADAGEVIETDPVKDAIARADADAQVQSGKLASLNATGASEADIQRQEQLAAAAQAKAQALKDDYTATTGYDYAAPDLADAGPGTDLTEFDFSSLGINQATEYTGASSDDYIVPGSADPLREGVLEAQESLAAASAQAAQDAGTDITERQNSDAVARVLEAAEAGEAPAREVAAELPERPSAAGPAGRTNRGEL